MVSLLRPLLVALVLAVPAAAAAEPRDGLESVEMDALRERMRRWDGLAQAWFRLQSGDADGARKDVQTLLRGTPGDPDALHLLGIAAAAQGRDLQALHVLRTSLRRRADPWVGTHLVHLLVRRGNDRGALRTSEKLRERLPGDPQVRRAHAYALVASGQTSAARVELQALEREHPDAQTAHRLALLHTELGEDEAALAAIRRAVDRDPERGDYRLDLFKRLEAVGDWTGLSTAASEAGADAVGGGRADFYKAIALVRLGESADAVEAFSRVVSHGSPDPVALAGAAGHLLQLGAYAPAEASARAAVADRPEDPALHHLLAMTLTRQTREQEALAYYRRAADLLPDDASYRFDLLVSLCTLGRSAELAPALDRAVRDFGADPRFPALRERCVAD